MGEIKAYIDSFDIIAILVDKSIDTEEKKFFLVDGEKKTKLELISYKKEYEFNKYEAKFIKSIILHKEYKIVDNDGNSCTLRSGSIVRDPLFSKKYCYHGKLGNIYTKESTTFRVWSPVAKEANVILIYNGKQKSHPMHYNDKENVWELVLKGNYEGYGYLYSVRVFDTFEEMLDPYALSSNANAIYNYVVDPNKFYKMKHKKPDFSGTYTDAVIYEVNIKDFTQDLKSSKKGCFLGMLENNETKKGPTGIEYIKSLGVTHVQLLPTFDFEDVDDINKTAKYNWGYNPLQYFVPAGWYSENPDDPYSRINELLMLIDAFHEAGIRVNMDVVFNHVYITGKLAFDRLCPGYTFRVNQAGEISNASGCGNVMATERYQTSKLVIDVLKYYAEVFNVSGFRFDLMGLLDIDTLNLAEEELRKVDKTIMLYGEGWNMLNPLPDELRPTIYNHRKIKGYAFFNDRFRDNVRGSQWSKSKGYAFNHESLSFDMNHLFLGSCLDYYRFDNPTQTINYVECHDNYTFYDFGVSAIGVSEYEVFDAARVALEIVLVSQGVPFIHAGEEFFRTKQGVENSYNSRGLINKFNYARRDRYYSNVETMIDLISIRKEYSVFRLPTKELVEKKVHSLDGISGEHKTGFILLDDKFDLFVIIKNDYKEEVIDFNDMTLLFDGFKKQDLKVSTYALKNPGVYIFRKDK